MSPYRMATERGQTLRTRLEATCVQLASMELNATVAKQVATIRNAFDAGDLDIVEAYLFLQRLLGELDRLPTELPALEGGVPGVVPRAFPGVTDLRVTSGFAVFRCDGHPMVHELVDGNAIRLHTSVRRAIPFMHAIVRDSLRIQGSSEALASEVTLPLLRLGSITPASLTIRDGLATVYWRYDIEDETTHALAIECLIALRGVRMRVA